MDAALGERKGALARIREWARGEGMEAVGINLPALITPLISFGIFTGVIIAIVAIVYILFFKRR